MMSLVFSLVAMRGFRYDEHIGATAGTCLSKKIVLIDENQLTLYFLRVVQEPEQISHVRGVENVARAI